MSGVMEEVDPLIKEKTSLFASTKNFETVEKAEEFLLAEKYRQFGGQFGGPDLR